jgi:TPR repeat protein
LSSLRLNWQLWLNSSLSLSRVSSSYPASLVHLSAYKNRISRKTEQQVLAEGTLHDIHDQPLVDKKKEVDDNSDDYFKTYKDTGPKASSHDPVEQIQLLRQQAEAGDPNAQFQLGQYLYFGNDELGIEPQPQEADRMFRMAAENNHHAASVNFAIMLINSRPTITENRTGPTKTKSEPTTS